MGIYRGSKWGDDMYYCEASILIIAQNEEIEQILRQREPLERFSHHFKSSAQCSPALVESADVIIVDDAAQLPQIMALAKPRAVVAAMLEAAEWELSLIHIFF